MRGLVEGLKLEGAIAYVVIFACGVAGFLGASWLWVIVAAPSPEAWPRLRGLGMLGLSRDEQSRNHRSVEEATSMFTWVVQVSYAVGLPTRAPVGSRARV